MFKDVFDKIDKTIESVTKSLPNLTSDEDLAHKAKRLVRETVWKQIFPEKNRDLFEYKEWYTNSSDYLYLEAVLDGLDIKKTWPAMDRCIKDNLLIIDETTILENNRTLEIEYTKLEEINLMRPYLDFLEFLDLSVAPIPYDCYLGVDQIQAYYTNIYNSINTQIGNDPSKRFGNLLTFILLVQLTNANEYMKLMRIIMENGDRGSQNYIVTMNSYAKIANMLLINIATYQTPLNYTNLPKVTSAHTSSDSYFSLFP